MSSPIVTFRELVGAEWLKLRTTRTAWVLMIVGLAITGGLTLLISALADATDLGAPDVLDGFALAGTPIGLVMLVMGVLGMAGEFRHGTITYTFLATPRRALVVLLKLGVFLVAGAAAAAAALVLIQLVLTVVLAIRGIAVPWPHGDIWWFYARIILTTGLFAAFGVAVAALLRSQVLAVALVLSWMVLEVTILPPILMLIGWDKVQGWLPLEVFLQATGLVVRLSGGEDVSYQISPNEAMLLGIGYIAVVAIAAILTTMRRDVT
jgi:ABC-2 type transport system permease protein